MIPAPAFLSNPERFMAFSRWAAPLFGAIAIVLAAAGLWLSFTAPEDYQQGDTVRIMFIHVPAAWLSMFVYACLGGASFLALVFRHALADAAAKSAAPLGAAFTVMTLVTGALWGKPMWGAWWVWDARLTSELILLFLYLGFIALHSAIDDPRRAARASGLLAIVGAVNVPIIYFSVQWWNTLHQGASISLTQAPTMAKTMLAGMLVMAIAAWCYTVAVALARVRCEILERERHADWIGDVLARESR